MSEPIIPCSKCGKKVWATVNGECSACYVQPVGAASEEDFSVDPDCVCCAACGKSLHLRDGCEWPEDPRDIVCSDCSGVVISTLRAQVRALEEKLDDVEQSRDEALRINSRLQSELLEWQTNGASAEAQKENARLKGEVERLTAQIHDLCHDKHTQGPITPEEFCNGCEQFQVSLFGRSPIADLRAQLETAARERNTATEDAAAYADVAKKRREWQEEAERERDSLRQQLAASEQQLRELTAERDEALSALRDYASRCPNCGGVGWFMRGHMDQPEQEQCEWCDLALMTIAGKATVGDDLHRQLAEVTAERDSLRERLKAQPLTAEKAAEILTT